MLFYFERSEHADVFSLVLSVLKLVLFCNANRKTLCSQKWNFPTSFDIISLTVINIGVIDFVFMQPCQLKHWYCTVCSGFHIIPMKEETLMPELLILAYPEKNSQYSSEIMSPLSYSHSYATASPSLFYVAGNLALPHHDDLYVVINHRIKC